MNRCRGKRTRSRIVANCLLLIAVSSLVMLAAGCQSDPATESGLTSMPLPQALTNGKPTIAEFGRGTCIPCKQMKPILEEMATEFEGRLNVVIVSIDDYQALTSRYRITAIPTQICFDSQGKEVGRHIGLWPKEQIIRVLPQIGID